VAFDEVFAGNGTRVIQTPARSPRANSFAEQFVGTLRRECLDHLLILGKQHLRAILAEYSQHYNGHRPHQTRSQRPPQREPGQVVDITARIERTRAVGGLISEYRRAARRRHKPQLSNGVRVLARHSPGSTSHRSPLLPAGLAMVLKAGEGRMCPPRSR
jgi:Integrase core domain